MVEQGGNTVTVRFTGPRTEEVAAASAKPEQANTTPQPLAPVVAPKHDPVEETPAVNQTISVQNPVQPAAADLTQLGQDVVLFDNSQPRQVMQASNGGMNNKPNLTTLPPSFFESKDDRRWCADIPG